MGWRVYLFTGDTCENYRLSRTQDAPLRHVRTFQMGQRKAQESGGGRQEGQDLHAADQGGHGGRAPGRGRSGDESEIGRATSELQSQSNLVCRLLLEKKKKKKISLPKTR